MGQSKSQLNFIICGLDNSGKTTILNQIKPPKERTTTIAPTVGYNVESFSDAQVKFTAFDMGGSKKFRGLWESYYQTAHGVIFVVDSADVLRLCVVKDEIQQLVSHPDIQQSKLPVLLFANKMDLPGAKNAASLTQILELNSILADHSFNIFASDALRGIGLDDGMAWLRAAMLKQEAKQKKNKK